MSNDNTNQPSNTTQFKPKKSRAKPKAKPIEPRFLRISCPDCGGTMRTIYSRQNTPSVQERNMICTNDECLAVYKFQVCAYQQITPPMPARLASLESDSAD